MTHLALHATGQAPKRRLIPRQIPADRFLADVETWIRAEYPDVVRTTATGTVDDGLRALAIGFHPAATDVVIAAGEDGEVSVQAAFAPVGPGYQTFVGRLVQRIGTEHGIEWAIPAEEPSAGPARLTDPTRAADRPTAEHGYLAWLGSGLIAARDARRRGAGPIHLGTPGGVRYDVDGAVATCLGPRDDEWLESAVRDSRLATDITPWWADATDARYLLYRALCLMWTDVRWIRHCPTRGVSGSSLPASAGRTTP
jgi:hypothetical protein